MKRILHILSRSLFLALCLWLVGCSFGGEHGDLRDYINEIKRRPKGTIEPLPTFTPYESFVYSAAAMRSPFDQPIVEKQEKLVRSSGNVKPNFAREREFLETFNFSSLTMVGTLKQKDTLWALIKDPSGGIHTVSEGNYMGKNHGRVIATALDQVDLIEIVSDGLDGWVERPRVIKLFEKE